VQAYRRPAELRRLYVGLFRFMGDQLPGFQGELKIRRGLFPPSFRSFQEGGW